MVLGGVDADDKSSEYTASSSSTTSASSSSSERSNSFQQAPENAKDVSNGVTKDLSLLAPQIWHHIFTFCPPKSLGNLLTISKLFNYYLDPASTVSPEVPSTTPSKSDALTAPLKPNDIWRASRRLFWPNMPTPLKSKTELDMWWLACSNKCQFCDKSDNRDRSLAFDARHPGPGSEGVAALWAFSARMCAPCLLDKSIKEVDLLISRVVPLDVASALPFVFLTPDFHALSVTALEIVQHPADLQLTKRFFSADFKILEEEFLAVKDMGSGTVTEWLKGLAGRGKDAQHDAAKWEKYESTGGIAKMCSQLYPGYISNSLPPTSSSSPTSSAGIDQQVSLNRQEQTIVEAAELKAARKAEIERRAMLLEPPLTLNILRHIVSFQAASQIAHPLGDSDWEILKPRLIAQRADAEQREKEIASAQAKPQSHLEMTLASTKEARDLIDKDWEEVQAPLRVQIAGYADDIIRDGWGKGKKVSKDNCARFAIDALTYVRKHFYAAVAKDAAAARAAGQTPRLDPPDGPYTQKLTLENMKWIFDTKVKPHTDSYRKELFYCNGCEGNYKTFGLEGVIQHYAAKHTSALSLGNIIVYWRAEWPEYPPFSAEVRPVKPPPQFYGHGAPTFGVNGVPPPLNHVYPQAAPPGLPPASGYGYGGLQYNDPYHLPLQPFAPQLQQPPPPPPPPHPVHPQPHHSSYPAQVGFEHHTPYAGPPEAYHHPSYQQPPGFAYPVAASPSYVLPQHQYGHHDYSGHAAYTPPASCSYGLPQPPIYPNLHATKLEDVARNSREVWQQLGNIRDLPGSVKVFVTIHHLVKRFRSRFIETPPLAMFIDGLSNNKDMRPVRNVNGLICRACHLGLGNAATVDEDRKTFSLPQLANHFQSKHVEPIGWMQVSPLDWVVDMVYLADISSIYNIHSLINPAQRALIADALPEAFQLQRRAEAFASNYHRNEQHNSGGYGSPSPHNSNVVSDTTTALIRAVTSTTPTTGSDNAQVSSGRSSQNSRLNRAHSGLQSSKKDKGKNKRKRNQGGEDDSVRRGAKEFRRHGSGLQHEEHDNKRSRLLAPQRPDERMDIQAVQGSRSQSRQPLPPTEEAVEPDIMDALELHLLSQRRSPRLDTAMPTHPHCGEADVRGRGPFSPQHERAYTDRPGETERRADEYGHRLPPDFVEHPVSQRSDNTRYNDREYGQGVAKGEAEYAHYRDEMQTQPRPPVETYEIVHVIDGQESYYIRRPVRREPEVRYVYEEPIAAYEGSRGASSRSGIAVREGNRASVIPPEAQSIDRLADPPYVEEYDPRYGR
ncbi:hypothetical protein QBC43DRAFT_216506 [Cladorrhinum sp. PSN259]|nr:hypothetical protein QBC43DRAFT_216506 [Cladorrhinum sp. PSN259]